MKRLAILLAVGFCAAAAVSATAEAGGGRRPKMVAIPLSELAKENEMIAVVPRETLLAGRVLLKDGVTPVSGAEVSMQGVVEDAPRLARSDRAGGFQLKLPAGRYALRIARRMEIYEARTVYRVPAAGRVEIDFLLLPDFEKGPGEPARRPSVSSGPDPRPSGPAVVGSVVDMMRSKRPHHSMGPWAERLGYIASFLAVALAAR
jgi:hypothetical protein